MPGANREGKWHSARPAPPTLSRVAKGRGSRAEAVLYAWLRCYGGTRKPNLIVLRACTAVTDNALGLHLS